MPHKCLVRPSVWVKVEHHVLQSDHVFCVLSQTLSRAILAIPPPLPFSTLLEVYCGEISSQIIDPILPNWASNLVVQIDWQMACSACWVANLAPIKLNPKCVCSLSSYPISVINIHGYIVAKCQPKWPSQFSITRTQSCLPNRLSGQAQISTWLCFHQPFGHQLAWNFLWSARTLYHGHKYLHGQIWSWISGKTSGNPLGKLLTHCQPCNQSPLGLDLVLAPTTSIITNAK